MKFACDAMLGALARWLRVSGIDVYYNAGIDRSGLFRVAREEGRTILTRTHAFEELTAIPPYEVIESEIVEDQVPQFFRDHPEIDPWSRIFTRCIRCNELLEKVAKDDIEDRLEPLVKERITDFNRCPSCDRIYWAGTHVDRMKAFLVNALGK